MMTRISFSILLLPIFILISGNIFGQDIAKLDFKSTTKICKFESNGTVNMQKLGFQTDDSSLNATKKVRVFHSTEVVVIRAANTRLNLKSEKTLKEIRGFLSSGHTTGYHPNRMVPVLLFADQRFTEIGSALYRCWVSE